MNILRQGILPPAKFMLYGECDNCHCQIEIRNDEAKYDGVGEYDYWSRCPTPNCNDIIKLFEK